MGEEAKQVAAHLKLLAVELRKRFPVQAVYLFGSWAKGMNHAQSDIDVALIVPDTCSRLQRFEIYSAARDFDINYDIVIIPESDYMTEDPLVVHELKTSGIRVA